MTGEELIQIRLEAPTEGVWTIRVYGELVISGTFNIWLPITEFVGDDVYFLKPNTIYYVNESGRFIYTNICGSI